MALASLRHKPLSHTLEEMIYRTLEAKFTCEPTVGKTTTLMIINREGVIQELTADEIQKVRVEWEVVRAEPPPEKAIAAIKQSRAYQKTI